MGFEAILLTSFHKLSALVAPLLDSNLVEPDLWALLGVRRVTLSGAVPGNLPLEFRVLGLKLALVLFHTKGTRKK